jgi:hypothetical protein
LFRFEEKLLVHSQRDASFAYDQKQNTDNEDNSQAERHAAEGPPAYGFSVSAGDA